MYDRPGWCRSKGTKVASRARPLGCVGRRVTRHAQLNGNTDGVFSRERVAELIISEPPIDKPPAQRHCAQAAGHVPAVPQAGDTNRVIGANKAPVALRYMVQGTHHLQYHRYYYRVRITVGRGQVAIRLFGDAEGGHASSSSTLRRHAIR
jgi:hypothetical protein